MKKRWLSILLVCGMLLTTMPSAVFAEGEEPSGCVCTAACTAEAQNPECPTCGAKDAALEDCAKYEAKQENEPNDTQEPADPQEKAQEEPKATEPAEEPTAPAKSQVAVQAAANNKAAAVQAAHTHCACGGSISAGGHTNHSDVAYTPWNGRSNITYTNNTAYVYLTSNVTLSWLRLSGKTLYLCLNGNRITFSEYQVTLDNDATLYLCDCSAEKKGTISSNTGKNCCVLVSGNNATFNMYGGTLRDGRKSGHGGGVNIEKGTMNMYGGTITENTSTTDGGGIYVGAQGALNLYGGTITGNKVTTNEARHGGGVYVESNKWSGVGKISISGSPVITGNTRTYTPNSTTTTENVYLGHGFTNSGDLPIITLGTVTSGANIGIWAGESVFSTASETDYSGYFSSDVAGYHVEYNAEKKLELKSGAAHTHTGGTATCTNRAVCETCGREYGELNPANHSGTLGDWQTSDTEHWQVYSCCKVEANRAAHSGGTADCQHKAVCTTCGGKYGDVDPTNHTGTQGEWKSDGDKHWKEYSCCGVKVAEGTHAFTAEKAEEQYLKSGSTCEGQAEYYKSCDTCGLSSKGLKDEATFFSGNVLGHDYGIWTSNGDGTHTRVCSRDSSHTESGTCSGGTATCTAKAICEDCGGAYGEMAAHDFTAEVAEEDYLKSPATCTTKAVYYKSCAACGKTSKGTDAEATFESGNVLGHDWGEPSYTWTAVPDGYMCVASSKCKNCDKDVGDIATVTYAVTKEPTCLEEGTGTYTATFSGAFGFPSQTKDITLPATGHDWGTTEYTWTPTEDGYNCTAKRICQKDKSHAETETVTAAYAVVTEPTCLTDGLGRYQASFDADWAEDASKDVPLSALDHDWGAWTSNGDGTHTRVCTKDSSHTEDGTCSGGTATCTERAICDVCGGAYGDLAAHDFTAEVAEEKYLKSEATCTEPAVYYKSCKACGLTSEGTEQEDTFQYGNPLGHDYDTEWSQDETHHWYVCKRCQDVAELEEHTASGWITDKAATAKADGERHKECTVCGYILETDTIPATGSKTKPGKQDNTKTRTKTNAPKTGDDSTLLLWTALLGVSGVGATGVVRYGRKRKDNE